MLPVVGAPSAAVVASIASSKSAVVSVAALVASSALVTQSTKTTVLVALSTLQLVQVTWVAAKALLVRLLRKTLSTLAGRVVRCGSRPTGLSSEGRRARSTALGVSKRLQRIFIAALLTCLLLAIRALATISALGSSKHVGKTAKATRSGRRIVLILRCS